MKRRNMLKSVGVAVGGIGLAGCGQEEKSRSEKIHYRFKSAPWLAVGESISIEFGDDQWRIGVASISGDTVELDVTKYAMDETGANKEGGAGAIDIERSVDFGNKVELEPDCIVVYLCRDGDEVRLGMTHSQYKDLNEVICDE